MAKAKILIVEDEGIVAEDIKDILRGLGYTVLAVAYSGEQAIKEISETHPDLVLMDIVLKGEMDGVEAAEQIRARFNIPVVYLTAYADEKILQRAKITEPYGYVLKPFGERELYTAIEIALYKYKTEKKLKESEQWLSTTLKSIGDAVIATDAKRCIKFMNPVAEALTRWKQEDALDKDLKEVFNIINEETHILTDSPVMKVLQDGVIVGLENHILIARDGTEIPIGDSAAPIKDDKGNIIGAVFVFKDVTERKRMEETLRENEERFRAIFNTAQDCIFIKDCSLKYLQVNPSMERLFGVPASELIGKTDEELFGEEVAKHIREMDSRVLKGEIVEGEHTKPVKGILRTFHHIKVPVHNPKGEIIGLCGIAREITERKRTEESLKKTQEWLQFLVSATPAMLYSCNSSPPYAATFVSENIKVLLDYEPREFIENPNFWADNIHPEDAPHIFAELSRLFEKGYHAHEYRFRRKDGTYRWMHDEMNLLRDENGNPSEIFGYWTDITEHKQMEEALRVSAQEWRTTFDAISDAVCLLELHGKILRCNVAMTKLFDKPFEKIIGRTCWEIMHGTSNPIKGCPFVRMLETHQRETMVLPISGRWLNVTVDPVLDKAGNLIGGIHIIRDITERKRAEEELESSREQLRNLSAHLQSAREEERRHIAREIHDELGQALTALKMDISWLINKLPESEKPLIKKTKSISELIDTTIQTGQRILTELRPGLLDDLGLVAAIEWQAEEFQKRTGIKCEATLDPEEIILDQDRSTAIFRIFQETLTNVSRHANATKVKVNLRKKAGKLILKVKDNGKGITEKQISDPKSFGLIGIRERVHLFGGEVKISGIRDKGTTVTVNIPLGGEA